MVFRSVLGKASDMNVCLCLKIKFGFCCLNKCLLGTFTIDQFYIPSNFIMGKRSFELFSDLHGHSSML